MEDVMLDVTAALGAAAAATVWAVFSTLQVRQLHLLPSSSCHSGTMMDP